jgi:hypothetical protein
MMFPYKTYLMALVVSILPWATEKLGMVDWNGLLLGWGVPENMVVPAATAVSGLIMIVMRFITQVTTVHTALLTEPPKE